MSNIGEWQKIRSTGFWPTLDWSMTICVYAGTSCCTCGECLAIRLQTPNRNAAHVGRLMPQSPHVHVPSAIPAFPPYLFHSPSIFPPTSNNHYLITSFLIGPLLHEKNRPPIPLLNSRPPRTALPHRLTCSSGAPCTRTLAQTRMVTPRSS